MLTGEDLNVFIYIFGLVWKQIKNLKTTWWCAQGIFLMQVVMVSEKWCGKSALDYFKL